MHVAFPRNDPQRPQAEDDRTIQFRGISIKKEASTPNLFFLFHPVISFSFPFFTLSIKPGEIKTVNQNKRKIRKRIRLHSIWGVVETASK